MKIKVHKLMCLGGIALIAAAGGVTGCQSSSSSSRTYGQKQSDREIKNSVSKALKNDSIFKYGDVKANVYNGNIQLTGFVSTPEQRLRAAELASHVKGADQVINDIMIKSTPTGPVTIRDPLGHDTGRVMLDTNAPMPEIRNLPPNNQGQQAPNQYPSQNPSGTENAPK